VQPHYLGMGRGLARNLFALMRGALYYRRVRDTQEVGAHTPESRLSQERGNSESGFFGIYPAGRHLGSPAVAPELHSTNRGRLPRHAGEVYCTG
jgi:hypothetical protein